MSTDNERSGLAYGLAKFAVSQPVLANLVAISLIVYGAVVLQSMTRESLPEVPTAWAQVSAVFPGASVDEVEQLVTTPIENAIKNVDGIEVMWGVAREGTSFVFVKFDQSVENVDNAVLKLSNEVGRIRNLPDGVEKPAVFQYSVNIPTISVAVRGDAQETLIRRVGLDISDKLEQIDGVSSISQNGVRDLEIAVEVDPDRLHALSLPLNAVANSLRVRANNVAAGTAGAGSDSRLVRGLAQVNTAEEVRNVVVRPDPQGAAVRVADVAEVKDGFAPARITGRINGEPGILLMVRKKQQADSLRISKDVRAFVGGLDLPEGVQVDVFGDAAHEVRRSLDSLYGNAAVGLVLVLALLWFFVGGRNATMAAVGLPVALAGAFTAMATMGITINVISLLALILCLGVVVDDAIIIIENIYRHMEEGLSRKEAAIVGTKEVFWPVMASTATTCAAFLPMLLMTGVLGEFFSLIPKVVIASLVASLIEAFFVLPSHMADFGRVTRKEKSSQEGSDYRASTHTRPETRTERIGRRIMSAYERTLRYAIGHRKRVLFVAYLICGALLGLAGATKEVVLFTDGDVDLFDVRVHLPTDASKAQTDRILEEISLRVRSLESKDVEAVVAARGITRTAMGVDRGDHLGMVTVYLKPGGTRSGSRAGKDLLAKASSLFDDLVGPTRLEVIEFRPGPPRGAPVAVRVFGDELDRVVDLSEQVTKEMRKVAGSRDVSTDYELGKRELQIRVDEQRAALHMLTPAVVGRWLRDAFGALPVATTRNGEDEIDIVVRLNEASRRDPASIENLSLMAPDGTMVALRDIATIENARGPAAIRHRDGRRLITVTSQIDSDTTTSSEVGAALMDRIEPLVAGNPDITFELGGQFEETGKSLDSLFRAFLIAILLIYTILATQFRSFLQPVVVMSAIPLSFIGVVVGFFVSGAPVGLIALVGVVGLAGIVVNDSLVLVDFINQRRNDGLEIDEAIVEASRLRLRPIFLTSITTVAGLFPLALAGSSSPILAPMATAIAWGLSFATVLTLLIVPCLYRVVDDFGSGASKLFAPLIHFATDPGDAVEKSSVPD